MFFALYQLQEAYMPLTAMRQESFYSDNSFWYVFFYVPITVTLTRAKYYGAWKLSMSGMHASGITYSG